MNFKQFVALCLLYCCQLQAQTWVSMGLDTLEVGWSYNSDNSGTVIDAQGKLLYVGTNKGLLRSTNSGSTWEKLKIAENLPDSVVNALAVAREPAEILYVSIAHPSVASFDQSSNLYKSSDGGKTWKSILDSNVVTKANIADVKVSQLNPDLIVAVHRAPGPGAGNLDQVFKTTDGGQTWTSNTFSTSSHGVKISIGISPTNSSVIYATGDTQFDLWFYASTNWGVNWSAKSNIRDIFVQHILADLRSRDSIYVVCGDARIYISRNGGSGWEQNITLQNPDPPYHWVYKLVQRPTMSDWFFAATNDGVWVSKNNLNSWMSLSNGLPAGRYYDIFVDSANGYIYAGGENGLFRFDPLTNVPEEPTTAPIQFQLRQNYPNPFNPSTTISYNLPVRSQVTLEIFNMLGQEVATLVDGELEAGRHQVTWNAAHVSGSLYLYRLNVNGLGFTKKMSVVR